MMALRSGLAAVAVWLLPIANAQSGSSQEVAPATYCWDGRGLLENRRKGLANDPSLAAAIAKLRRTADRVLDEKLRAVTDKNFISPSGDQHDYVSLAPYFWPNPNTANGLPYVLRDGETNPENLQYDTSRLRAMSDNVRTLALAYYLTGESRYADRAARQLRCWFLDQDTRMNPQLKYARLIKGMNQGSHWGIIDTAMFIWVVEADALLQGAPAWPAGDHRRLQKWFADYLAWLRTSDLGKQEANAPNNQGCYYDWQVADFALFTGQRRLASEVLEKAKLKRIAQQIEPDGTQPQELARAKSYDYTLVNLTALFGLASVGDHAGVDLWNYRTLDGRSLRGALDWMIPFTTGAKIWTHRQITPHPSNSKMVSLLRQATIAWQEPAYEKMIASLTGVTDDILWVDLVHPLPKS